MISLNLDMFFLFLFVAFVVFFVIKISTLTAHINILQTSLNNLAKRVIELEERLKCSQNDTENLSEEKHSPIENSISIHLEPKKEEFSTSEHIDITSQHIKDFKLYYPEEKTSTVNLGEKIRTFFEDYVVSKFFLWLGGLALIFAGFFLAKYSIEQGLLSPLMRVSTTAVFAFVLLVGAEYLKRKNESFSKISTILFASALAVAYGDFYAAGQYYDIISDKSSFFGSVAVSVAGLISVRRYGSSMIYLASFGALLAPAIFSTENPSVLVLLIYLFVVTVLTLKVSVSRNAIPQVLFTLLGNVIWLITINLNISEKEFPHADFQWLFWYTVVVSYMFYWCGQRLDVLSFYKQYPKIFANLEESDFDVLSWIISYTIMSIGLVLIPHEIYHYNMFHVKFQMYSLSLAYCLLVSLAIWGGIRSTINVVISVIASFVMAIIWIKYAENSFLFTFVGMLSVCATSIFVYFKGKAFVNIFLCIIGVIIAVLGEFGDYWGSYVVITTIAINYLLERKFNCCCRKELDIAVFNIVLMSIFFSENCFNEEYVLWLSAIIAINTLLYYLLKDETFNFGIKTVVLVSFPILTFLVLESSTTFYLVSDNIAYDDKMLKIVYIAIVAFVSVVSYLCTRKRTASTFAENFFDSFITLFFAGGIFNLIAFSMVYFLGRNWMFASFGIATSSVGIVALLAMQISERLRSNSIRNTSYVLMLVMSLLSLVNVLIATNNRIYICGYPILNASIFGLLLPALLILVFSKRVQQNVVKNISIVVVFLLMFVFANVELKLCFVDNFINTSPSPALYYSYSALWLFMGVALLALGRVNVCFRYLSLCLVLVAVSKVFIFDAANLDGILRVASFAMLGVVLIGIGYVYKRYILK